MASYPWRKFDPHSRMAHRDSRTVPARAADVKVVRAARAADVPVVKVVKVVVARRARLLRMATPVARPLRAVETAVARSSSSQTFPKALRLLPMLRAAVSSAVRAVAVNFADLSRSPARQDSPAGSQVSVRRAVRRILPMAHRDSRRLVLLRRSKRIP